jgi:nucleotide-binding universal stress UspA family protein
MTGTLVPLDGCGVSNVAATDEQDIEGAAFPFRDFVVARTYEARADAAATLVARALAERMGDEIVVVRVEGEALERQARHAALVVVGTPTRRRPATMPGGNASVLVRRLCVPLVVVPPRVSGDLTDLRSIVCGVRDHRDTVCAAAAGALADALDLQLVLVHVSQDPLAGLTRPLVVSAGGYHAPPEAHAARTMVGDLAQRAGRSAPGAARMRIVDGAAGQALCEAAGDERAALIAVGASRHGPMGSALRGSVARHVTRHADRPVLLFPHRPDRALRLRVPS